MAEQIGVNINFTDTGLEIIDKNVKSAKDSINDMTKATKAGNAERLANEKNYFQLVEELRKREQVAALAATKIGSVDYLRLKKQYADEEITILENKYKEAARLAGQAYDKEKDFIKLRKQAFDEIDKTGDSRSGNAAGLLNQLPQVAGILGTGASLASLIADTAKLSDIYVDVAGAAGLSNREVTNLNKSLLETPSRTNIAELLGFAEAGAKAGVESNLDIFAKNADKLKIALGKELGANAEESITSLTKISNIFNKGLDTKDGQAVSQSLLAIGNGIQYLANKGVASGEYLTNFTQRLGGLKELLGDKLTLADTIGLGAGFEELGQNVEVAASTVTTLLTEIGTNIPKFAKLAGLSTAEFAKLYEGAPVEALLKLTSKAKESSTGLIALQTAMKDAGVEGSEATKIFGVLAGNADKFREKIRDAGIGLQSTELITEKFNAKQVTLAASLDKLGNALSSGFQNSKLEEILIKVIDLLAAATPSIIEFVGTMLEGAAAITGVVSVVAALDKATTDYTTSQGFFNDTVDKSKVSIEKERLEMSAYIAILKDSTSSEFEKQRAKDALIKQYPEYVRGINLEKAGIGELTTLENSLTDAIIKRIAARDKGAAIEKLLSEANQKKLRVFELKSDPNAFANLTATETAQEFGSAFQKNGTKIVVANTIKRLEDEAKGLEAQAKNIAQNYDKALGIVKDGRERFENEQDDRQGGAIKKAKASTPIVGLSDEDKKKGEQLANELKKLLEKVQDDAAKANAKLADTEVQILERQKALALKEIAEQEKTINDLAKKLGKRVDIRREIGQLEELVTLEFAGKIRNAQKRLLEEELDVKPVLEQINKGLKNVNANVFKDKENKAIVNALLDPKEFDIQFKEVNKTALLGADELSKIVKNLVTTTDADLNKISDPLLRLKLKIMKAFGIDETQLGIIQDQFSNLSNSIFSFYKAQNDAAVKANEDLVKQYDVRISSQQKALDVELERQKEGSANNVENEKEKLKTLQSERDAADKKGQEAKEKATKLQLIQDGIQQGSALVTTIANIYSGFSKLPIVGLILGIAAVASFILAFSAAKSKVTKLKGGGRMGGYSHNEGGNDMGNGYETERGEWVVNGKDSSEQDKFISRVNAGEFRGKNLDAILSKDNPLLLAVGQSRSAAKMNHVNERQMMSIAFSQAIANQTKQLIDHDITKPVIVPTAEGYMEIERDLRGNTRKRITKVN